MRVKVFAAFCLTLLFAALCALPGDPARAQGSRRRGSQPAPQAAAPQPERPKQVIIGRGADNQRGSRMTITSDEALNDYSAYRSGDRFYVELPNANAATAARAAGRGFTDLQVQRRGKNVVLSYRVQPGAKPRVEQRFNRLEVIFEVPAGEAAQAAQPQPQTPATNPGQTPAGRIETAAQPAPGQAPPAAGRTPASPTPQPVAAAQTPLTNPVTPLIAEEQSPAAQSPAETAPSPVEQTAPAAVEPAPQELAQAQPPAPAAPATTNTVATQTGSGTSVGAFLLRNWAVVLVAVLLLAGIGLLIASRRTTAAAPPPPAAALAESPAVRLDERRSSATAATVAAPVAAPVAAAAVALKETKKESRKAKKAREAREAREKVRASAAAPVAETAAEPVAETAAETAPSVATPLVAAPVVAEAAVEETVREVTAEETVTAETVVAETAVEAPAVVEPEVAETVEEEKGIVAAAPAATPEAEPVKELEPVVAVDPDRAHAETRLLLEGAPHDRGLLSTRDAMARQMIASELLSALAGRNAERRERARTAFNEFGYFDEKADDLRTAEAAAERSSAARALGLAGDPAATPHLVAALEDDAVEVRRAAVESLAALRDPSAVAPLEALLRREKKSKTKVNRKLVEHAVQACREGVAEVEPVTPAVEAATEVAPAVEALEESRAGEPFAEVSVAQPEPEMSVAPPAAEPVVTQVADVVAEPAAAEPAETPAAFEEAPAAVEEPAVAAPPVAVESVAPVEETAAPASLFDATETFEPAPLTVSEPATVAEPATAEAPTVVEEMSAPSPAFEAGRVEVETAEASSAATWEEPAASPDVSSPAQADEPAALFEEEVAAAPSSQTSAVEEASPFGFEGAAVAEEGVAAGREERAEEWVELDISGLSAPPSVAPAVPTETVFETSGGEMVAPVSAESLASEPAAPAPPAFEPTASEVTAIEPAESAIEPAGVATEADEAAAHTVRHAGEARPMARLFETEAATETVESPAFGGEEKGVAPFDEYSSVPANLQQRLASHEPAERAAAVVELARVDTGEAFQQICAAFDDDARDVRSAAARALYDVQGDRADSFTRALREASADRRRNIGAAIASSGLASDAISQLTGESREKTYEAFSLLFLMAKAGEVAPLVRAIEGHPNNEVRLAVVKLLALSGQKEILPAFRRLAVRGSLPTEVRSAVMEAIYQISSQSEPTPAA